MNNDFEQIKTILIGLTEVSDSQYKRLLEVYGEDVLVDTIKELYNVDNSILLKVGRFVSDLYLNLDDVIMDAYDYYIDDIKSIDKKTNEEKNKLLNEIVIIVKKLNKLFNKFDDISMLDNNRIVPWIADKVEYCLMHCNDVDLLTSVKKNYNEYVDKRNLLLASYLKFVIMIAKSFRSSEYGLDIEDLIQYGNMGLIRAIEMYNSDKDVEFLTYAGYWIKQSIIYNSKKIMYPIKLPVHWYETRNKWARAIEYLTQEFGRYPSFEEIAKYVDIEPKKLLMIINSFQMFSSLDEIMEFELDKEDDECIFECGESIIEDLEDKCFSLDKDIENKEMSSELEYYMNLCLSDRDSYILKSRFGFIDRIGASELSKMFGVSESRVYQIIQDSRSKLFKNDEFKKMKVYLR